MRSNIASPNTDKPRYPSNGFIEAGVPANYCFRARIERLKAAFTHRQILLTLAANMGGQEAMTFFALLVSFAIYQEVSERQAVMRTVNEFAAQVKNKNAVEMAACMKLVCEIRFPNVESQPSFNKPSHPSYASSWCRYFLAYQRFAQTLQSKYDITFPRCRTRVENPRDSDISPLVNAIKECTTIRKTIVTQLPCREYHFRYDGHALSQRFVLVEGKWYLGSIPYTPIDDWDFARNDPATYAISEQVYIQLPGFFRQAEKMAEQGKSKEEIIQYLRERNLYPDKE